MISIISTAQMVIAASPRYDFVWSMVAGLIVLQLTSEEEEHFGQTISKCEIAIAGLTFFGIATNNAPFEIVETISPIVWCLFVFLVLISYVVPRRSKLVIQRIDPSHVE